MVFSRKDACNYEAMKQVLHPRYPQVVIESSNIFLIYPRASFKSFNLSCEIALPSISLPQFLVESYPLFFLLWRTCSVCFDCPAHSPEWASVSHGTLVCLQCAGRHRTLGVHVSRIKSLTMDAWEPQHVAAMLLSGNAQVLSTP